MQANRRPDELTLIHLSLIACSVHQKQWWLGIHEFGLEM
jgi:hypothetical protein